MNWSWNEFLALVRRHRFPFAIAGTIGIALIMTAVSLSLYVSSGTSRLDLSRPGYEQVRKTIKSGSSETFKADGSVDKAALDEFERLFQKHRTDINSLGSFKDGTLDDASLDLSPDTN